MSLLNLPETLREFGSPRNYFEGKYLGERFVQEVKNVRKQCLSVNVCGNLLKKLHQGKSLESVAASVPDLKTYRLTAQTKIDEKKRLLAGNVHVYKDKYEAIREFYKNTPVSILGIDEDKFGILFYEGGCNRGCVKYLELRKNLISTRWKGGDGTFLIGTQIHRKRSESLAGRLRPLLRWAFNLQVTGSRP